MHYRKALALIMCTALAGSMTLTGCNSTGGNNSLIFSDTTLTGTVEEIDGQTVTLTVGSAGGGQVPEGDGQSGTPPEMPEGDGQSGTAPEMPEGDGQSGTPPEMPEGDGQSGTVPEMPEESGDSDANIDAEASQESDTDSSVPADNGNQAASVDSGTTAKLTISDESVIKSSDGSAGFDAIKEGDVLTVTFDDEGVITEIEIGGAGEGSSADGGGVAAAVESYDALQEFTEDTDVSKETYASTGTDENAIHIYGGANVTLEDITASRDSDNSTGGDASSFYGVGADLLVSDGAAYINGGEFTTDAKGGAGIFAYDGGTAYVSNARILTTQDTSGGVHAAGGGALYAWNLEVETSGESSAAIRSDRGGGTMVIDGGKYVSNGTGSPAVYCTADIAINESELVANNSEGICIEGKNTLRLYDCSLTGNMSDDSQNDCTWNVIVYQSMSGDSEIGNSTFHMVGGSLTAQNGGLLYTTNTECTMLLSNVDITYAGDSEFFLRCTGNQNARGWGEAGSNGSQCRFTADSQEMEGDVIYDSISTLDFYMTNESTLEGAFVDDETYAGAGGGGYCNVYVDADSAWIVTKDSTVTALYSEGAIRDAQGNSVSVIGTDGTVYVNGNSEYTITVTSYETKADMSGAETTSSFSEYKAEKPEALS